MHPRFFLSLLVAMLVIPAIGEAQDTIPKWGAEATTGGGTSGGGLLRFSSRSFAWVLQATVFSDRIDGGPIEGTFVNGDARFGARFYRRTDRETRPFATISALLGYEESGGPGSFIPGAAIELGASHFFSPHVSLGVSADLRVLSWREQFPVGFPPGTFDERTRLSIAFSGFRLLGGVYF